MEPNTAIWSDFQNLSSRLQSSPLLEAEATPSGIKYSGLSQLDGLFGDVGINWVKKAWNILQKTPLSQYHNEQEFYAVIVRLFCLGEITRMYHSCISEAYYDSHKHYLLWANGEEWIDDQKNEFYHKLERVRFIVLAGDEYYKDEYIHDEGITYVIDHLIEQEYETILNYLIVGFGDKDKFLKSLKYAYGFDDDTDHEKLSGWQDEFFPRDYL